MSQIDDVTLIAYVDGELDPATSAEVETALAGDAALRTKVRELRESTALLRAAFNHALYGPIPEIRIPETATAKVLPFPSASKPRRWEWALAASLAALAVGGFGGYYFDLSGIRPPPGNGAASASADEIERGKAFVESMDKVVSGNPVSWSNAASGNHGSLVPVRTFQNKDGQYCREFEEIRVINGTQRTEGGIACRGEDGVWKVRMRFYPE